MIKLLFRPCVVEILYCISEEIVSLPFKIVKNEEKLTWMQLPSKIRTINFFWKFRQFQHLLSRQESHVV